MRTSKTVDYFRKNYRTLDGSIQNRAIRTVQVLFFGIGQELIADGMWDCMVQVWYSYDTDEIKFEPKTFANLITYLNESINK